VIELNSLRHWLTWAVFPFYPVFAELKFCTSRNRPREKFNGYTRKTIQALREQTTCPVNIAIHAAAKGANRVPWNKGQERRGKPCDRKSRSAIWVARRRSLKKKKSEKTRELELALNEFRPFFPFFPLIWFKVPSFFSIPL